jgi:3-dehydroquinate synthase
MIPPGEKYKNLSTLSYIWEKLLEHRVGREAVLINLGGGVITDMGGMAAATYKRGISFIQLPTTLLGMVDAAIGGKTGINVKGVKNMAGTYSFPVATLIDPLFLETLPFREIRSGLAEIIKYTLIYPASFSEEIFSLQEIPHDIPVSWIVESARIKEEIVVQDPSEIAMRKTLNFGHTAGHALESLYGFTHGESIAVGMCIALYLSIEKAGLDDREAHSRIEGISRLYRDTLLALKKLIRMDDIWALMQHDKKNTRQEVRFVLLNSPGNPVWDVRVELDEFSRSLEEVMRLLE